MNRSRHPPADDESHAGFVRRPIRRWRHGKIAESTDAIAEEVPVALVYNDRPHVVMMATPRDLDDFALGFSLSEGVIGRADELESIEAQPYRVRASRPRRVVGSFRHLNPPGP